MCGIAGEVGYATRPTVENVARIAEALRHRGPDDGGVWTSPDEICVLGHRRLSIIDLSPLGHQPMVDPETGNTIVFNGEIYNFQTLRAECESLGDRFNSQSDTEVILALYRRYGAACLSKLRGMFAFAIWDTSARRLFLARDRVGKKPLHYAANGQSLIFSSELRPLSRHPFVDRAIDTEALELYLQLQSVPAPWTIYRGIRKLPPAHFALFDTKGLRVERYWNVDYRPKTRLSDADALEAFEEKLTEAVQLRMISDVPLGALLSGGVDSSVVVALMSKLSAQPVRTFSIGFAEESYNELPYAERAAHICRSNHNPKIVAGDAHALVPLLARHYGEPFADSSAIPSFLVSRMAREQVTVVLNGDGGDELLGGYPRYAISDFERFTSTLVRGVVRPDDLASLAPMFTGSQLHQKIFRRLLLRYCSPELNFAFMYSSFWDDLDRAQLLGQNHSPQLLPTWRRKWLKGAADHADSAIDRMLWTDNRTYLPDDLMVKMDIASMHTSLEARSPLLDHEIIEFCAGLEAHHKVRGGVGKYLLKKLALKYFPSDFVCRSKMGFAVPLADWLSGPLRQTVRATLLDKTLMAPLSATRIQTELTQFERGETRHASRIWALFMFGQWRLADAGS